MIQASKERIEKTLQSVYQEVKQIDEGNGGNSWVFKIKYAETFIAIKVLRRFDRYERFKEEVSIASNLSKEKGICPIIEFNLPKVPSDKIFSEIPYFTMPFYPDGSLEKRIIEPVKDGGSNAISTFKQIVAIIQNLHKLSYAHRDLKPENILIVNNNEFCVSDFGLCLDLSKEPIQRITKQEEIIGSFYYRAPEYLRGKLDVSDHRPGDVFSLGRILWSLILGKQPIGYSDWEFYRNSPSSLVADLRKPYIIDQLINNCTQVDPVKRPNVNDILEILNEWEYEPKPNSIESIKDDMLNSEELFKMKENEISWNELQKIWNDLATFGLKILEDHPVYGQLKDIYSSAFPERKLSAGIGSDWNSYVLDMVSTIGEKVITLGFNVGNLKLAPFIIVDCNFNVSPMKKKFYLK